MDFLAKKYTYNGSVGANPQGLQLNTYDNNLNVILGNSDLRLSLIQRPGISKRIPLVQGIIRLCLEENLHDPYDKDRFRNLMKAVNIIAPQQLLEIYDQDHPIETADMDALLLDALDLSTKLN